MTHHARNGDIVITVGGRQWIMARRTHRTIVADVIVRGTVVEADCDRLTAAMHSYTTGEQADRTDIELDDVMDYLVTAELA